VSVYIGGAWRWDILSGSHPGSYLGLARSHLASRLMPLFVLLAHRVRDCSAFPSALASAYSWLAPLYILYAPHVRTRAASLRTASDQCGGSRCITYCTHLVCVPAPLLAAPLATAKQQACTAFHLVRQDRTAFHIACTSRLLFAALWLWPNTTIQDLAPLVPLTFLSFLFRSPYLTSYEAQ
jgi:hypothetical protein